MTTGLINVVSLLGILATAGVFVAVCLPEREAER